MTALTTEALMGLVERRYVDGLEQSIALLADELNQFALVVEVFAEANSEYAEKVSEARPLFHAARRLRERIAELIPS